MAAVPTNVQSASVCVVFPPDRYPKSLEQATALFAPFGEIARMDMTLGSTTGRILVTYFDIRNTERVLVEYKGSAELFPPAAHDFRAVSIAASIFAELPSTFSGFHAFGEIAGASICGEDMVVEFYDMRAAQQVTFSVPGSRPRRPLPAPQPTAPAVPPPVFGGLFPEALLAAVPSLLDCLRESLDKVVQQGLQLPTSAALAAAVTSAANAQRQQQQQQQQQRAAWGGGLPADVPAVWTAAEEAAAAVNAAGGGHGPGRPVREKVNVKDLTKFDIVPEKIQNNEDSRTTVMIRNIPKACSREAFVELLDACGLQNRYSFFYMPFDKRRHIHCGFAFVNFRTPHDVLLLHEGMQLPAWRCLAGGQSSSATPPALSYARLQGQEQLIKHFSLSAVMYDNDARKRPLFCGDEKVEEPPQQPLAQSGQQRHRALPRPTEVSVQHIGGSSLQPRYVSLPSTTSAFVKEHLLHLNGGGASGGEYPREADNAFLGA